MDWSPVYKVTSLGFILGMIFGALASKTNFCTMGAVSDWVNMGDKNRLRAWLLAIGIAVLISQAMQFSGIVELNQTMYLASNFSWLTYILGGFLFGVGMTLASGCGQRTLVRLGGGNLKSLIVLLFLGMTAYMTMRGFLAPLRVKLTDLTSIDLVQSGAPGQGIGTLIAMAAGFENTAAVSLIVALVLGGGLVIFSFSNASFRGSFNDMLAGIAVGLIIPAAWYVTGVVGFDDFEPVRLQSFTFVAPTGNALQYLMTFTGSTINFGVAAVGGVLFGSFLFTLVTRNFHLETFTVAADMVRHIVGGILMGFGGVLALGCTVGQGISGMSTLALGSLMALTAIMFGSALTMKVEYYLMDNAGFLPALRHALADLRLLPAERSEQANPGGD